MAATTSTTVLYTLSSTLTLTLTLTSTAHDMAAAAALGSFEAARDAVAAVKRCIISCVLATSKGAVTKNSRPLHPTVPLGVWGV